MSRLADEIKAYQEAFIQKVPPELVQIMMRATEKLKEKKISENAKKSKDSVRNFSLPDVDGATVSLDEVLKTKDFAVVSFYRGGWCPYCNLELNALQKITTELADLNAELIAISPQTPDNSLATQEKNELSFKVLSDVDNIIAKEFGLIYSLDVELRSIYKDFGIDIEKANNSDTFEIPMPATYIINKKKEIIYHFIDEDYSKRLEPQTILQVLKTV